MKGLLDLQRCVDSAMLMRSEAALTFCYPRQDALFPFMLNCITSQK